MTRQRIALLAVVLVAGLGAFVAPRFGVAFDQMLFVIGVGGAALAGLGAILLATGQVKPGTIADGRGHHQSDGRGARVDEVGWRLGRRLGAAHDSDDHRRRRRGALRASAVDRAEEVTEPA